MATLSTNTPTEILQRFYAAEAVYMATPPDSPEASTNFDAMAACFAPDLKVYQPKDLPWGGTWEGTEGFLAWGKVMKGYFDKLEPEPIRILDDGKETVVVESIIHVRIKGTGEEHDVRLVQIATVDLEKGVIKDIRQYPFEMKEVLARLGK
jgi:ketosteroid isomerase-like protein